MTYPYQERRMTEDPLRTVDILVKKYRNTGIHPLLESHLFGEETRFQHLYATVVYPNGVNLVLCDMDSGERVGSVPRLSTTSTTINASDLARIYGTDLTVIGLTHMCRVQTTMTRGVNGGGSSVHFGFESTFLRRRIWVENPSNLGAPITLPESYDPTHFSARLIQPDISVSAPLGNNGLYLSWGAKLAPETMLDRRKLSIARIEWLRKFGLLHRSLSSVVTK